MLTRKSILSTLGAVALASVLGAPVHGKAESSAHLNYLTFSGAVSLPGVTLPAGTYVFEQLDNTTPDIVVVRNRDRNRVFFLGFTTGITRPAGMRPDRLVTFSEAERGTAPRILAWYPVNESRGHAFTYPR